MLLASIVIGIISGISHSLVIPVILKAINGDELKTAIINLSYLQVFILLFLFILLSKILSQVILNNISLGVTSSLRKRLYRRINQAEIKKIESVGVSKLNQALNTDVQRIVSGANLIPDICVQIATLIGLFSYLAYINTDIFFLVFIPLVISSVIFQFPIKFGGKLMTESRLEMDQLQDGFRGLILGAKELKLNSEKSDFFIEEGLYKKETKVVDREKKANYIFQFNRGYAEFIFFTIIATAIFYFLNAESFEINEIIGVMMVLIYISGPVSYLVNVASEVSKANVSLRKYYEIIDMLPGEMASNQYQDVQSWKSIKFVNVSFQYTKGNFSIRNINCQINRNEVVFIVGGNGSGKSTFSKILSLHNYPNIGSIFFDDVEVTSSNIKSYRKLISCIYSDYYLFKELNFQPTEAKIKEFKVLIEKLGLKGKVDLEGNKFSTLKLSDGQRRRLALIIALMEERDLYIFDEWAADQDPEFKERFYKDIIPELKLSGKTVILISHDDRYFYLADKIFKFESGVLINY